VTDPFPPDVVRFLDTHVESIDQLEMLRVLGEDPARGWPVSVLAVEVQAPPGAVAGHAAALRARGLLATTGPEGDPVCRFAPATPDLDALTRRVLGLYRERPVSMIKFVYARAADPLRAFADAFRLRKEG
jgi:hypothetical protein